MSEWSHLANAKHIDLIIAHVEANRATWNAAKWAVSKAERSAARYAAFESSMTVAAADLAAYNAAWDAAHDAAWDAVRQAVYDVAWYSAHDASRFAAQGAILALVAWDQAGGLMNLPAEQVKVLAILGDQAAILMYPAIVAMETTQELA